jgi:hypothetical protein
MMSDKNRGKKISLQPLKFEEAVSAFLKVKPEPKKPRTKGGDGDKPRR